MNVERRGERTRIELRDESRFFTDLRGVRWQVFELICADGSACLVFESTMAIRRVRHYPADWRELSDEELATLSWSR